MSRYKREESKRSTPRCPSCGVLAVETPTQYGIFCECAPCGLVSWNRYPLVSREVIEARKAAHASFDRLWREDKLLKRGKAYEELAGVLGVSVEECHFKTLPLELLRKVPAAVAHIRAVLSGEPTTMPSGWVPRP